MKLKRCLALTLAVLMILSTFPIEYAASGDNGTVVYIVTNDQVDIPTTDNAVENKDESHVEEDDPLEENLLEDVDSGIDAGTSAVKEDIPEIPVEELPVVIATQQVETVAKMTARAMGKMSLDIDSKSVKIGSHVTINISIKNNPGIVAADLRVEYDEPLELVDIQSGEAFESLGFVAPKDVTSPCYLSWSGDEITPEEIKDGIVASLIFEVSGEAEEGASAHVSVSCDSASDNDLMPIDVVGAEGSISIISFVYGDVDGNGKINAIDAVLIQRYIADGRQNNNTSGYNVSIDERAADAFFDNKVAASDATAIKRKLAGWIDYQSLPYMPVHEHKLTFVEKKEATTQEEGMEGHWKCSCGKYFKDENASEEISREELIIPALQHSVSKEEYTVRFYSNGKQYAFQTESGVSVPEAVTKKSGETYVLPEPFRFGYTFLGWCDSEGNMIERVNPGSYGELGVSAKWTSNRNLAVAETKLRDPAVYEDPDSGKLVFVYKLGQIQNVQMGDAEDIGNLLSSGNGSKITYKGTTTETQKTAENISESVEHITTDTSAWELSDKWNSVVSVREDNIQTVGEENTNAIKKRVEEGGKYNISSSNGGETVTQVDWGGSSSASAQVVMAKSSLKETDKSITNESGSSHDFNVNVSGKITDEKKIGASLGLNIGTKTKGANAGLEVSDTTTKEIGAQAGYAYNKYNKTTEVDQKHTRDEKSVGTSLASEVHKYKDVSVGNASTWNTQESFERSKEISQESELQNTISEMITKSYGTTTSLGQDVQHTNTVSKENTDSNTKVYSNMVEYGFTKETEKEYEISNPPGKASGYYYRFYPAGILDVYAVVEYDIATGVYATATYSKFVKTGTPFIDCSTSPAFDDENNSVLPFEIPYEIHDYISAKMAMTDGLEINREGIVTGYYGTTENVVIPDYVRYDYGNGTHSFVTVKGISDSAFVGSNVKVIRMGEFVTEIADNTFSDCRNLETVIAPSVTSIGSNAFNGCINLKTFKVPNSVTYLGDNAFAGVNKVVIEATNAQVANAAVRCSAKNIELNMDKMEGTLQNLNLNVSQGTEVFSMQAINKRFENVQLVSSANETKLYGMTFANVTGEEPALKLNSEKITLSMVTVESQSLAMLSLYDGAELTLFGESVFKSTAQNAVLTKGLNVVRGGGNMTTAINVTGKMLVCGSISYADRCNIYVNSVKNGYEIISSDAFDDAQNPSRKVYFNPNGGKVGTENKTVGYQQVYGGLPTPTRDYYTFDGWYTAASGGQQVTASTTCSSSADVTLYAHWTLNPLSNWVAESSVPEEAKIAEEKWNYTLREYTTSAQTSYSGWTKYDTKRTSWGTKQGPVYSNPSNGVRNVTSEQYVTSSNYKTVYVYYRWTVGSADTGTSYGNNKTGTYTKHTYRFDYQLTIPASDNPRYYAYYYTAPNGNTKQGKYKSVLFSGTEQVKVSDNYGTRWYYQEPVYTYYYYRDVSKTGASNPTGQTNVSNIQHLVRYRAK